MLGIAFKRVSGAEAAFRAGRVPPKVLAKHAKSAHAARGSRPHVVHVWESVMKELRAPPQHP